MDLWICEREEWARGAGRICGTDEAGAGPLAGPVYAAAVILPRELEIRDSTTPKNSPPRNGTPCSM
jgi:ribonuclease HII